MALVMLPCDMPWWPTLQRHLNKLLTIKHTIELIEGMANIHDLCNISLDPDDEEIRDPDLFIGLLNFLDNDLTCEERLNFMTKTLPNIINRALNLKQWKPGGGLHFSLQQQADSTELDYNFVSSLIAHGFFSTFPKRTEKTHPTLQDFNFSRFFKFLNTNTQKSKLRSLLYYFDWLDTVNEKDFQGHLKIHRQIMSSKEWLTIEDWLECSLPLCPLHIKHEGRLDRSEKDSLHICFATSRLGDDVLGSGMSQECINFTTFPELLSILLNVEALEDNEVLTIQNARRIARINDPKNKAVFEKIEDVEQITLCCIDPEDYRKLPISQFEEDNILRELNKLLLGFQQKQLRREPVFIKKPPQQRRLSPIGESVDSTPPELKEKKSNVLITHQSPSTTTNKSSLSAKSDNNLLKPSNIYNRNSLSASENANLRRGKFIVLGSSGECLPVSRRVIEEKNTSLYSSCSSSEDEFHSARDSFEEDDDVDYHRRYSKELDTSERRNTFAQRLRDALRRETNNSSSLSTDDSSYAVGISVAGSDLCDGDIKLKRGGSRGFILEDSVDDDLFKDSLAQEQQWIDKFKTKHTGLLRKDTSESSKYSFSTDYSSELEEVYEQFSRWLEDPILQTDEEDAKRELDERDLAVVRFAGALLKRTLSESFAGVPLTDGCIDTTNAEETSNQDYMNKKNKNILNARSLSLELARQKHKLAAQLIENTKKHHKPIQKKRKTWVIDVITEAVVQTLDEVSISLPLPEKQVSQLANKPKNGLQPISTGNWGCGSSREGDVQLKVILQWLAASVAGVPSLIYYTMGHKELVTLDTLSRIIVDRKWTVKELTHEVLNYSTNFLHGKIKGGTLFEDLIGMEKNG